MLQAERRYDRLGVRLSLIINRLIAGETLYFRSLAAEFGVSTRTLRRDFRERLMYLDLEYHKGSCRLLTGDNVIRRDHVALAFARQSGVAELFPGLDNRLVNTLLESGNEAPFLVWQPAILTSDTSRGVFYRLTTAITGHRRITLLAEGQRCEQLAPYRLISLEGCWYLAGEAQGRVTIFPLSDIRAVTVSSDAYIRDEEINSLISCNDFITALPHFRFINEVTSIFNAKPLLTKTREG
ncbi:WYL domain-containing protein [Kluyvera cryocrescens]|uniref:WYL domain-containing protein n=1 Tax=Kluyvera cryocrescens TaxID=580 RepID=UPI0039F69CAF